MFEIHGEKISTYQSLLKGEEKFIRKYIKNCIRNKAEAIDFIQNGLFSILEALTAQETFEYLDNLEKIEFLTEELREKDMEAKGVKIEADSRMQFWETDIQEQYLSIIDCFNVNLKNAEVINLLNLKQKKILNDISNQNRNILIKKGENAFYNEIYKRLAEKRRFDILETVFEYSFPIFRYGENRITIADIFAGNGNWLNRFNKLLNKSQKNNLISFYNEIDEVKYQKNRNKFTISQNEPAENLIQEIPKKSISIMIFNPPYGNTNGHRNVNRFLDMVLKDDIIANDGIMLFALNRLDIEDNLQLILQNFEVELTSIKKFTNKMEFNKLKQYYFVGYKRSITKIDIEEDKKTFLSYLNSCEHSKILYKKESAIPRTLFFDEFAAIDIKKRINEFTADIKDLGIDSILKYDKTDFKMEVPRKLKLSEMNFFLSRGKIQGQIEIDGKNFFVNSGTKNEKTIVDKKNEKGEIIGRTEITKETPYINIINDKREMQEITSSDVELEQLSEIEDDY